MKRTSPEGMETMVSLFDVTSQTIKFLKFNRSVIENFKLKNFNLKFKMFLVTLPTKMGKCLVGLRHFVRIFTLFNGAALVI